MTNEINKKLYNIDFLRVIATFIIVDLHLWLYGISDLVKTNPYHTTIKLHHCVSYIWVEFFFIISGFFLMYSINKKPDWGKFALNRAKRLWVPIAVTLVLTFILAMIYHQKFDIYGSIMTLIFLQATGFYQQAGALNIAWFVGPLFFANLFYSYVCLNFPKKIFNLLVCLMTFFGYIFIINNGAGSLHHNRNVEFLVFSAGMVRAVAGCGAGIIIYNVCNHIKENCNLLIPLWKKLMITFAEIFLICFTVNNTVFHKISFKNHFIIVAAFIALIILFVLKRGFVSKILDIPLVSKLGNYSYNIYLMQNCTFLILSNIIKWFNFDLSCSSKFVLTSITVAAILLSVILGWINYIICKFIYKRI